MFSKKQRLTKKEFSEIFLRGVKKRCGNFLFVYLPKKNPLAKFAVVCPKKIIPGAVKRNQQKRRIYRCLGSLGEGDFDVIIFLQKSTPQNTLCSDLIEALKQTTIVE